MNRSLIPALTLCAVFVAAAPALSQKKGKPAPPAASGQVKQENQFQTVDEIVHARRAPGTIVSVEGYAVTGFHDPDGSVRLTLVDSIDHVLNAKDADAFARGGVRASVPASAGRLHPGWAWSPKGIQRFIMWTGPNRAMKQIHDVVPKTRVTATFIRAGTLGNVSRLEFTDENGDWKPVK